MKTQRFKKIAGTNLVEMIAVIVIIGIVAVVGLPKFVSFNSISEEQAFYAVAGTVKTNADTLTSIVDESQIQNTGNMITTMGANSIPLQGFHNNIVMQYFNQGVGNYRWIPIFSVPVPTGDTFAQGLAAANTQLSGGTVGGFNLTSFSSLGYYQNATQCAGIWTALVADSNGQVDSDKAGGITARDSSFCSVNTNSQCSYVLKVFNHGGYTLGHGCYAAQVDGSGNQTGRFIVMDWYSIPIVTTEIVAASVLNPFTGNQRLILDDPAAGYIVGDPVN